MVIGVQNVLGGFLLAIVNGNEADFMHAPALPALAATRSVPAVAHTSALTNEAA